MSSGRIAGHTFPVRIYNWARSRPKTAAAIAVGVNAASYFYGLNISASRMMATGQLNNIDFKFLAFSSVLTAMTAIAVKLAGRPATVQTRDVGILEEEVRRRISVAVIDARVGFVEEREIKGKIDAAVARARDGYELSSEVQVKVDAAVAAARIAARTGYVTEAHLEAVKERARIAAEAATRKIETLEEEKTRAEAAVAKAREDAAKAVAQSVLDTEARVRKEMTAKGTDNLPTAAQSARELKRMNDGEVSACKERLVAWVRAKYPGNPHMEQAAHDIESLANDRPDLKDEIQLILHQSLVEARLFEDAEKF